MERIKEGRVKSINSEAIKVDIKLRSKQSLPGTKRKRNILNLLNSMNKT